MSPGHPASTQQCVCRTHGSSATKQPTRNDHASAWQVLARVEAQADNDRSFAQAMALHDFVASELTTLFACDLVSGHPRVVGLAAVRLSRPAPPLSGTRFVACHLIFFPSFKLQAPGRKKN